MILPPHRDTETTRALLDSHRKAIVEGVRQNHAACAGALLYASDGDAAAAVVRIPMGEEDPAVKRHYAIVRGYLRQALAEQMARLTERSRKVEALLADGPTPLRIVK